MKKAKTIILMGIVVGLLYAIGSRGAGSSEPPTAVAHRKPVADLTITDLNGKPWRLSDHRGQVVLLNFWATWCPPCREETPGLVRLAESRRADGLEVVGVSMDEGDLKAVRQFASEFKVPYPIGLAAGEDFPLASAVEALPTTLLIDKEGRLAKTFVGGATESEFRAGVDALLQEREGGH